MLLITILVFIGLSIFLAWYFIAHDQGEKEPVGALWAVTGMGLVAALAAGFIENVVLPKHYLSAGAAQSVSLGLLLTALGVGVIEECCKFLPAALFLYKRRYFNEHTDGIIYFALAGLGFGLPENIMYTIQFGAHTGLLRIVMTPFFHSATTSFVGYFLIKAKLNKKPMWWVGLALVGAIVAHGVYDFGAFVGISWFFLLSLFITAGMTALMFILFMRARELDQAEGLAVVGNNSFCRSCGFPNPKHNLYCARCGKRA